MRELKFPCFTGVGGVGGGLNHLSISPPISSPYYALTTVLSQIQILGTLYPVTIGKRTTSTT